MVTRSPPIPWFVHLGFFYLKSQKTYSYCPSSLRLIVKKCYRKFRVEMVGWYFIKVTNNIEIIGVFFIDTKKNPKIIIHLQSDKQTLDRNNTGQNDLGKKKNGHWKKAHWKKRLMRCPIHSPNLMIFVRTPYYCYRHMLMHYIWIRGKKQVLKVYLIYHIWRHIRRTPLFQQVRFRKKKCFFVFKHILLKTV